MVAARHAAMGRLLEGLNMPAQASGLHKAAGFAVWPVKAIALPLQTLVR